jgi:hypothetical protein
MFGSTGDIWIFDCGCGKITVISYQKTRFQARFAGHFVNLRCDMGQGGAGTGGVSVFGSALGNGIILGSN